MFARLVLLFTAVPLLELLLLIEIGQQIGLGNTIAIVLLTGFVGAALARTEGFGVLRRIQSELHVGQLPADSLFDGALILAGALLLLTPGLITDVLGLILLIPGTRKFVKHYLRNHFRKKMNQGEIHVHYEVDP